MVQRTRSDQELSFIGYYPLAHMLDNHAALIAGELEQLYRTDPKWRQAFEGQMSESLGKFAKRISSSYSSLRNGMSS
jgi:hypothetical protein